MLKPRVIPTLLLLNDGLVKGERFRSHTYVGDPINAVKIFNEKETDELVFLDIGATEADRGPSFDLLGDIVSEAFMPFAYGGGISNCEQIEKLFYLGVEKVVLNTAAYKNPSLVKEASLIAGSQSVVVSIDVKKSLFGRYEVRVGNGNVGTKLDPIIYAKKMEDAGAGEILLCSIDNEGIGKGFDLVLTKMVSDSIEIPVVASGGAGRLEHLREAVVMGHASAVSAGSFFIFHGKHKAVLITYPSEDELNGLFESKDYE